MTLAPQNRFTLATRIAVGQSTYAPAKRVSVLSTPTIHAI
jgi:hypothetical protein